MANEEKLESLSRVEDPLREALPLLSLVFPRLKHREAAELAENGYFLLIRILCDLPGILLVAVVLDIIDNWLS